MCGIVGIYAPAGLAVDAATGAVDRMQRALAHRGPDDHGAWLDAAAGIALGHRRLSIIDLSPLGHQPMTSPSGRFVVTFNGEIYNYRALRHELEQRGKRFRSESDTEVMLGAFEEYGVAGALHRLRGMFALGLWDKEERALVLARDRLGEKPLFYGWVGGGRQLVFGSELKSLRAHPGFDARIDRQALIKFMRHGFVPGPRSIYEGVAKVPPGTWVRFDAGAADGTRAPEPVPYFSLRALAEEGVARPLRLDRVEAADRLEAELGRAVRDQMVADVPLGAFLSGGIDSSTIVALMQAASTRPVKTFTIGFADSGYDEAPHARAVAHHLGTEHTEVPVTPREALAVIPRLPSMYDEPFADSSQVPTFLVSQVARAHVTVALTGDAGDELFGGYARYTITRRIARLLAVPGRRTTAEAAHRLLGALRRPGADPDRAQRLIDWAHRRTEAARAVDVDEFYARFMSLSLRPSELVPGVDEPRGTLPLAKEVLPAGNTIERAMLADGLQYLPDDILTKVDRAAMAVSLETRVPMLDPGVIALAWRLPFATKVRGEVGKAVLRDVLARYVPPRLFERPKMGFAVPIAQWLRGPLRDWAESLLAEDRLRREGFLDPVGVRRRWSAYLGGVRDWHSVLWNVLMWQAWTQETGIHG
ncbi:MAG TPA: asparagine synthase (glutamine-hydrolyzing) [Kofleriaceae bacterium]|nr:asparagine synthase (glutamine-hydrolyzing) [Kofleriaceae bacterium]